MTETEQRIAIAEATGRYERDDNGNGVHWHDRQCGMDVLYEDELPDYLHDLNAMHEAEKRLTPDQWLEYERVLAWVCYTATNTGSWAKTVMSAGPRQRAEAFLRTVGKWKE